MSICETIQDPSNLSSLYFDGTNGPRSWKPFVASDSFDIATITEERGRGMVAKKDLSAGTCLFVIPPTVAVSVDQVCDTTTGDGLESVAERVLLREMQEVIQQGKASIANSFLVLEGNVSKNERIVPSLNCLLAMETHCSLVQEDNSDDALTEIIRRNAFGPDFWTYAAIARNLPNRPHRILGLYPLADMMNHSCQANSVRVYVGEYMVVHTSTKIASGEEITASYVPPTFAYPTRQAILHQNHGFVCVCNRCRVEADFWSRPTEKVAKLVELQLLQQQQQQNLTLEDHIRVKDAIAFLEGELLPSSKPNERQRHLRLGFTPLYMSYFNHSLSTRAVSDQDLLRLCMQLHFGFTSCNPSSTEHLSILHLGYELIGKLHSIPGNDQAKTLPQLRFWTEQLKQACMTRYGNMGQDIQSVRRMMQHTRQVLRTPDGIQRAEYPFI